MNGHTVDPATLVAATLPLKRAIDQAMSAQQGLTAAPVSAAAYPHIPGGQDLGAAHQEVASAVASCLGDLQAMLERLVTTLEQTAAEYERSDLAAAEEIERAGSGQGGPA